MLFVKFVRLNNATKKISAYNIKYYSKSYYCKTAKQVTSLTQEGLYYINKDINEK